MPNPYRHLCLILAATLAAALGAPAAQAQESMLPAVMLDGPAAQAPLAGLRDLPLDETTLAAQRGRAAGMTMMVSATPMMLAGARNTNTVTLWDEIAPPALPAPLPMPADAPRPMQGNSLSMTRH